MEEKINEIIKMFDQAIELAKKRREFLISSNSEKVETIKMLEKGINILEKYKKCFVEGKLGGENDKPRGTLALGPGFNEFDSGEELLDIVYAIDRYYTNM